MTEDYMCEVCGQATLNTYKIGGHTWRVCSACWPERHSLLKEMESIKVLPATGDDAVLQPWTVGQEFEVPTANPLEVPRRVKIFDSDGQVRLTDAGELLIDVVEVVTGQKGVVAATKLIRNNCDVLAGRSLLAETLPPTMKNLAQWQAAQTKAAAEQEKFSVVGSFCW